MEMPGECFVQVILVILMLGSVLMSSSVAEPQQLNLMPMPASVQIKAGQLAIDSSFSVGISGHSDAQLQRALERFLDDLRRQTGMPPLDMKVTNPAQAKLIVHCEHESKAVQELGEDESYSLEISAAGAKLDATTTLGIMRGLETFLQLVQTTSDGFAVPAITIQDKPRFPWRGLMIDVGRHFIPLDILKRNLDGMAAVKLNVFHWHLSDNQGFRVESKRFPKLTETGSDGLFYTQDEVRDLIAYAQYGMVRWLSRACQRPRPVSGRTQVGSLRPGHEPGRGADLQVSRQLHRRNGKSFLRPVLPYWRGRG
jgi:hexosaminidase